MTRLVAIAASYRTPSLNKRLLSIANALAEKAGASITLLDYAALEAPIYRGQTGADPLPQPIAALSAALRSHDGMILATPEYNWSIPGGLKNILDWLSVDASAPLNGRTALLMCASPSVRGGITGLHQLRTPLDHLGCWVYPQLVAVGNADAQLQDGHLAREADQQHLSYCVTDFVRATKALMHRG